MKPIKLLLLILLFPLSLTLAKDDSSDFSEIVSDTEFTEAGLNKLTPEQLQKLNELWKKYSEEEIEIVREEAKKEAVQELAKKDKSGFLGLEQVTSWIQFNSPGEIKTRLIGTFNGWTGSSVFKFENGQIWRQRQKKSVKYPKRVENPEVTIFKTVGGYRMRIEGYRQTCAIKRIK